MSLGICITNALQKAQEKSLAVIFFFFIKKKNLNLKESKE